MLNKQIYLLKKQTARVFMLTRDQIRMARTAMHWTIKDLAREAGITPQTVTRFENGGNATLDTLTRIKEAFERAGITWVPENGGPAGVRPPRRPEQGSAR